MAHTVMCECGNRTDNNANFCYKCGAKLRIKCRCWVKGEEYICGEDHCPGYKLPLVTKKKLLEANRAKILSAVKLANGVLLNNDEGIPIDEKSLTDMEYLKELRKILPKPYFSLIMEIELLSITFSELDKKIKMLEKSI